jgi:ribosomal protein S19
VCWEGNHETKSQDQSKGGEEGGLRSRNSFFSSTDSRAPQIVPKFVSEFAPHHDGVTVFRAVQMNPNTRVPKFFGEFAPHGVTVSRAAQMQHAHTHTHTHTHNPNTRTLLCQSLGDDFGEDCRGIRTNLGQNGGNLGIILGQNGVILGPDLMDSASNLSGFGGRLALLQVFSCCCRWFLGTTYHSVLLQCQKRTITVSKEIY